MNELQKASMWKRISAGMFDGILLMVAVAFCAWLLSIVVGYDRHSDALDACYERYAREYSVDFDLSLAEYEALTSEELARLEEAHSALSKDETAVAAYNMVVQLTILIISIGILLGYVAMELVIPLILGHGRTLGKKIFGLGVMRTDGVKITGVQLFIRTVLGKYTIETMIPVLILIMLYFNSIGLAGMLVLIGLAALQVILMIATHTNSMLHDLLAGTVAVDYASQMIFDTKQALIEFKQREHAEKVARQSYE